jgi:pSer/pThr/pTyr-binding forkhead associated (FHA) protein
MHHEGGEEDSDINLQGLFEDSPEADLPDLGPSSRYVTLYHALDSANRNLVIGRSSSCDVVINDYSVSKVHARLTHDDRLKRTMVTDLGSRNGTFMDEHRLEHGRPSLIRSGDEIRLGRLSFTYLEPVDLYQALLPPVEEPTV